MNYRILFFILLVAATAYTKEVPVFPTYIDSPSRSERGQTFKMMIAGEYPNSCYSMGETYIEIKEQTIFIKDTAELDEDPEEFCLLQSELKPYHKELSITPQDRGEHKIYFMDANGEFLPAASIEIQ